MMIPVVCILNTSIKFLGENWIIQKIFRVTYENDVGVEFLWEWDPVRLMVEETISGNNKVIANFEMSSLKQPFLQSNTKHVSNTE